ncbi:MAG: RsmE family RNA methyltransferase, partial [Chloroflexi bacterium]|nr:RsmE family RNA methyltransferase [Chloroflexota bacterium]
MHRFFVAPECIQITRAHVEGGVARQVARVLRLHPGQEIVLLDNTGWEYAVILSKVSPSRLEGDVVEKRRGTGDPGVFLTLHQGILKGDKLDMVIQKGTEIGISAFVPVSCHRSVPRTYEGWASSRYPRWHRIIAEAT